MSSYKNNRTFQKEYIGSLPQSGVPDGSKAFIAGEVFVWDGTEWGYLETQNNPPVFANEIASQIFLDSENGTDTQIFFRATDPENTPLVYTLVTPPNTNSVIEDFSFSTNTGTLTLTPSTDEAKAGNQDVTVRVSDSINTIQRTVNIVLEFAPPEADPGGILFTSVGTHTWTVPDGVSEINAICIGGGGGGGGNNGRSGPGSSGGGGGGLRWGNGFAVSAGDVFTIQVGGGGAGGATSGGRANNGGNSTITKVSNGQTILMGYGGQGGIGNQNAGTNGGTGGISDYNASAFQPQNTGGGIGGTGGNSITNGAASGGGGAGGYNGNGGNGFPNQSAVGITSGAATGGAGINSTRPRAENAGGGVGIYGRGNAGVNTNDVNLRQGSGGVAQGATGGLYGGGGGTPDDDTASQGANGGQGAVRIIWGNSGLTRAFPETNVDLESSVIPEVTV